MKDDLWQKRQFILSSLRRLEIPLTTNSYRFADNLIKEGWTPPLEGLYEVDSIIKIKYQQFTNA